MRLYKFNGVAFSHADFTLLPAFFPSTFFDRLSKILPQKKRVKMPAIREVVGSWPCFYATIWLLCHRARTYFCHIARSDNIDIFYVVSRWANNNNAIFSSYCASERAMTHTLYFLRRIAMSKRFYCRSREKQWQGQVFTRRIARSNCNERIFLMSYRKGRWQSRNRAKKKAARLLFATIDATTSLTADIRAIVVVVLTTIAG